MKYKAIFIDIDDTLLDYIPCCREAFECALDAIGCTKDDVRCTKDDVRCTKDELFQLFFEISGRLFSEAKHGKHTIAEVMELYPAEFIAKSGLADERVSGLGDERVSGLGVEEMTDRFKYAFRAAWGRTHTLVPGAKETLENLRAKGYRLFAASNSFGHLQRSRLDYAGILPFFEDTYISMDIGYDKPDVRFYEEALRRCGLQAHEVVMIGDSMTTDVIGAKAAGLDAIYFCRRVTGEGLQVTGDGLQVTGEGLRVTSLSQLQALL